MNLENTQLGKYELRAEIGRGGMGTVYQGYDPLLARPVAIKVLSSHLAWEKNFVERFLREARAVARLKHPNIVTIHDVGEQQGRYYCVMEYLDGRSLSQVLQESGPLSIGETLSILRQLADALDYAHAQDLIHRDVKPANVMIDSKGHVTLTDFGLVQAVQGTRLTNTGETIGTPQYMSPEHAEGKLVGPPADLYSLAILAYEMLAGAPPFDADSTPAILYKHVYEPLPPILDQCPHLPLAVDAALRKALAKDPAERYTSAADFVTALAAALEGRAAPEIAAQLVRQPTKVMPRETLLPAATPDRPARSFSGDGPDPASRPLSEKPQPALEPPLFVRGPREVLKPPKTEIIIPPPPPTPTEPTTSLTSLLMPVGFTIVGLIVMVVASSSMDNSALMMTMAISLPMMLGSYVVSFINYHSQKRAYQRQTAERSDKYQAMLERQRQELAQLREQTQTALLHNDPDPTGCYALIECHDPRRLWARAPYDDDFLTLRMGLGEWPLQVTLKLPQQPSPLDPDPLIQAAHDLAGEFKGAPQTPVCLPLRQAGVVGLAGPRADVLNGVRALALQLATHHPPHEVKIVVIYPAREAREWEWLRWLPHAWSDDRERRFLAREMHAAHELLGSFYNLLSQRWLKQEQARSDLDRQFMPEYVFILADPRLVEGQPILPLLMKQGKDLGAFSVVLADRVAGLFKECQAIINLEDGHAAIEQGAPTLTTPYTPDQVDVDTADRFSRTLAPLRLRIGEEGTEIPTTVTLLDILGVERVEDLDVLGRWTTKNPYRSLATPVGKGAGGKLQYLDLHERKGDPDIQSGHGPHALVAGTTGSGKSELLQALVASLALHFHPHQVTFVLFDFKPPGLAAALANLPHVINVMDRKELELTPRALKSLEAELSRRMRLFDQAGVTHIDDYMERHRQGDQRADEPLPYLVLIVDEFTELKTQLPEAMDKFVQVATLGRAFGFRMILATQKPAGVISPQIDSNTALRLCLRVAKPEDSQEMIKRPDAAYLTGAGRVYMRVDEDVVFELFQSAWGGAHYAPGGDAIGDADAIEVKEVLLNGDRQPLRISHDPTRIHDAGTQLQAVITHIRAVTAQAGIVPMRGLWLPPLPKQLALDTVRSKWGWDGRVWQPVGCWLRPVIGLQDDPVGQSQPLLEPDLGRKGHLFICSGPGTDNRQTLRTLVTSLVLDHVPDALQIYCLDFGFSLQIFENLPHVGAIIHKDEQRRIARLFRWLLEELTTRKRWLAQHGLGSLAEARAQTPVAAGTPPALLLIVDNLSALGDDLDTIDLLAQLAREGQAAGVHLVLAGDATATRFSKVLDNVALRIGLQLEEAADYRLLLGEYPRDLFLPRDTPGRGLCSGPLECQVATSMSGDLGRDLEAELATLVAAMQQAWAASGGQRPTPIGVLPPRIELRDLLSGRAMCQYNPAAPLSAPLGLDDLTLTPIDVDLVADGPHFVIAGPSQSGKTTALVAWLLALAECFSEEMVQFFLLDTFKNSLVALQDLPHVRGYGVIEKEYLDILRDLDALLEARRASKQVRARPALVVACDDAEFLTSSTVKDMLKERARQDHPFGLHVILAGAAAELAQYDAFRKQILSNRSGMIVGSNDLIQDAGIFNLTLPPGQSGQTLPPGRAYLVRRGQLRLVQIATPGDPAAVRERVRQIVTREKPIAV